MLDADPQGTVLAWSRLRGKKDPQAAAAEAADIAPVVRTVRGFYDLLVVDTPGYLSAANTALATADLCLVPCRPSPADILAAANVAAAAATMGRSAAFVISQAPARGPRTAEAREALALSGEVAPAAIVQRVAFADAFGLGLGVTEYEPAGRAAAELRELWQWAERRMKQ